jgi:NAD(P)-dependent dehydrogenase (short-subunit alcohol dehydrogenase family)
MHVDASVALVTGGGSGLGAATARKLASAGAKVVVLDRDGDAAAATARDVGGMGLAGDVTRPDDVRSALDWAASLGSVRAVVHCAGIAWAGRTLDREGEPHDHDVLRNIVEMNQVGTINVQRLGAAAPPRSRRPSPRRTANAV